MTWDFDEILELNPRSDGQARSPVERLLDVGAASPQVLCRLADEMERRGPEFVAVLFQLPFPVLLDKRWERLPTSPSSLSADVSFTGMLLHVDDFGRFKLLTPPEDVREDETDDIEITQGVAVFHVWGIRQRIHQRYLSVIEQGRPNEIIASQKESWIQNRPITAEGYEENFSSRLRMEVGSMLARFLPAYSILSRSEAPTPHKIYGFAAMLSPGRISKVGSAFPLAKHFLTPKSDGMHKPVASSDLQLALKAAPRELGRFEAQLFAMERLRREDEVALSVVGTAALLEWLLASRLGKKRGNATLSNLLKSPELEFLSPELLALADEVRSRRNGLVHGAPPKRKLSRQVGDLTVSGREMSGDDSLGPDTARRFIEGVFDIFRLLNQEGGTLRQTEIETAST